MAKQDEKKGDEKPKEKEEPAKKEAGKEEPAKKEAAKDDKTPLIDEELFSGEADKSEAENNVFETEPIADDIPEGVDVAEHDADAKTA